MRTMRFLSLELLEVRTRHSTTVPLKSRSPLRLEVGNREGLRFLSCFARFVNAYGLSRRGIVSKLDDRLNELTRLTCLEARRIHRTRVCGDSSPTLA
jgi:hypothetical protein